MSRLRLRAGAIVGLCIFCVGSAPAPLYARQPTPAAPPVIAAGPTEPAPTQPAAVSQGLASQLFQAGRYTDAAEELTRAYALDPQPVFLFNIAQAYRKGSQPASAMQFYERFLAVAPGHPFAKEASSYLTLLKELTAEQARAEAALRRAQAALTRAAEAQQESSKTQQELAAERERRAFYKRGWFWGTIGGVTAVTLGLGLGLGLYYRVPATEGGFMDFHF